MKTVFFTGATGGLGTACVRLLSQSGWRVFAGGTNGEKLKALGKLPNVVPVFADVTSDESMRDVIQAVLAHTDQLNALVNFAGMTAFASLVEGDAVETVRRLVAVNVMGMARVNALFFPLIEKGKGRIVNCSSSAGWMTAQPFSGAYTLSKRAVEGYNDSLRRELMFLGIPVIKLQPGPFRTAIMDAVTDGYERTLRETTRYRTVLTRMKPLMTSTLAGSGDPEKLARLVLKALEAKRPRARYRIHTGAALGLLECLPEPWIDRLYRLMLRAGGDR